MPNELRATPMPKTHTHIWAHRLFLPTYHAYARFFRPKGGQAPSWLSQGGPKIFKARGAQKKFRNRAAAVTTL